VKTGSNACSTVGLPRTSRRWPNGQWRSASNYPCPECRGEGALVCSEVPDPDIYLVMVETQPTESSKDQEFARVVATHRHAITRYALRRLDDRDAVEDLAAEVFVVVWRRFDDLPKPDEQLFWLYAIAGRVLANVQRGRARSYRLEGRLAFEREREAETPRFSEEDVEQLMKALTELNSDQRELIQLAYWEELSYREMGLVLGCSEKAAGVRLTRAKRHLRDVLNGAAPVPSVVSLFGEEAAQ
jgi:RNA polymerase sigma factor (sigma-70 family)